MHTSATRRDVAQAAGVAESTVSRALSDSPLISDAVKSRVREAARTLGYVPSRQAARFATQKTFHLGFVVPSYRSTPPFSRPYFPTLLDGAVACAAHQGYLVTIISDTDKTTASDLIRLVKSREVDGLLISISSASDPRIDELRDAAIPLVLANSYHPGVSSVDGRCGPGMKQAFDHAISLGHHRIGFITGDLAFHDAKDRLKAFNLFASQYALQTSVATGDFSRTSGYRCAGMLLCAAQAPTLIMTSSDREAMGVYDYCRDHRIAIPTDVSVIGYDNLQSARDLLPPLSTVHNPIYETGSRAAQLLISQIGTRPGKPVNHWLDTTFTIRGSTAEAVTVLPTTHRLLPQTRTGGDR